MTIRCANLHLPITSDYQHILHDKIKELHDSGLGYRRIAYWLNDNGYKTPRGKKFRNTHAWSIVKKKRIREVRLSRSYEPKLTDFSLRFIDKTLLSK